MMTEPWVLSLQYQAVESVDPKSKPDCIFIREIREIRG